MQRKTFLQLTSLATIGLATGCARPASPSATFGIQLYSLRDVIFDDPTATLKQVASFGYKQIESYEGNLGMFWGMKNTEFKSLMDGEGMTLVASHFNMNENLERKVDEAAAIGVSHLICPWIGPQPTLDAYKGFAESFNKAGEICKSAGIRFAYHNHDYTFKPMDGVYPQDVLVDETDPNLVQFEMDMYWVAVANEDPIAWMKKHSGRYTFCHVKDQGVSADGGNESVTIGTGKMDYATILAESKQYGMTHFIVEQEQYTGTTPIDSARDNAAFMKTILV
jgi:sugar phosphate isomerase/epimerase